MCKYIFGLIILVLVLGTNSCDHIENPYPPTVNLDLDTTLYPGNWSDYVSNEWPQFSANSNI